MGKFCIKDIVIKSPGVQIREKIIEKYGTIKAFSDEIKLYEESVNKYLSSKKIGSSTFKIRMTQALEKDFKELYLSDEDQIRYYTSTLSYYIQDYNQKKDIEILEKLKMLCLDYELMEDYAIICRCYAHYYNNQGKKDRAYAYIDVAVNNMRDRENVDRFGLYLSDLLWMKALDLSKPSLRKLLKEFEETLKKVEGPLTTGHMYYNLGRVYFSLGELDKSKDYFEKVFDYHHDDRSRSFNYLRLGDIEKSKGHYDDAFKFYLQGESLLKEGDEALKFVYDEIALHYYFQKMYHEAESYIDKIFNDEKWEISSSKHRFIVSYIKVKVALHKENDIIQVIKKLLNEISSDYIYTETHLSILAETVELKQGDIDYLNKLSKIIINYYKAHGMDSDYKNSLERILGCIAIAKEY